MDYFVQPSQLNELKIYSSNISEINNKKKATIPELFINLVERKDVETDSCIMVHPTYVISETINLIIHKE